MIAKKDKRSSYLSGGGEGGMLESIGWHVVVMMMILRIISICHLGLQNNCASCLKTSCPEQGHIHSRNKTVDRRE